MNLYFYIANIYKEFGDNEAAKAEFEKVLTISPDYSWAYFNLASIYNEEGNLELAKENLIKTIEMNPKDREAYSILTKLYLKEKSYENAAKTITDCLNECDPTGDTCYLAAMAYKPLDKEEYISYLSNAIKHYQSLSRPVQAVKDELNNARDWD
jgi:Tfp pilus assembly protein PilF